MGTDEPTRCDGVPSAIRPAIPCAVCRPCIWRWTPASETYPRFFRPPMSRASGRVECTERREHQQRVGGAERSATHYLSGGTT